MIVGSSSSLLPRLLRSPLPFSPKVSLPLSSCPYTVSLGIGFLLLPDNFWLLYDKFLSSRFLVLSSQCYYSPPPLKSKAWSDSFFDFSAPHFSSETPITSSSLQTFPETLRISWYFLYTPCFSPSEGQDPRWPWQVSFTPHSDAQQRGFKLPIRPLCWSR